MNPSSPDEPRVDETRPHSVGIDRRAALKGAGLLVAGALPFGSAASAQLGVPAAAATGAATLEAGGRTLTAIMAEYAVATSFDKLSAAVRERAKKVIFDEIASSYFGQRSEGGRLAAQYVKRFGYPASM